MKWIPVGASIVLIYALSDNGDCTIGGRQFVKYGGSLPWTFLRCATRVHIIKCSKREIKEKGDS